MLTTQALAASGYTNIGGSSIGVAGQSIDTSVYPYYYNGIYDLAWRMDLYVSGRENGTIDKKQDTIARGDAKGINDYLRYVSSIIYTNANISLSDVYLQINQTDYMKPKGIITHSTERDQYGNQIGETYNLPTAIKLNGSTTSDASGSVYIVQGSTNGLPSSLAGCSKSVINTIAESADFMINITDHLSEKMGSTNFFVKIGSCISKTIQQKVFDLQKNGTEATEALQTLMPDAVYKTGKPLVEWAVTITPMMCWRASSSRVDSFWAYKNESGKMLVTMPSYTGREAVLIMDAYYSAIYNSVTTGADGTNSIWFSTTFRDAVKSAKGYIPTNAIDSCWDSGIIRRWFTSSSGMNILKDIGTCAYVDESGPIIGVADWINQSSYDDTSIAKYGGICINILEKKDNSIPVYYYITPTPNDPILPPSTATPPTFTPNPPAGTKVKKVIYPTDNSLVVPNNPPQDFPDPLPGNPPYTEITPTDGTYPIDPNNPPGHILVECVQTNIPIYYHVFTFTNTTGNDYKDVFEYLKDNPSVRESAAVENITAVGTTPILADGTKSTYTPQSSSSGTIVAALSTSGTNLGNSWGWLTQQGSTQFYKRMCSYKAFQACIILL